MAEEIASTGKPPLGLGDSPVRETPAERAGIKVEGENKWLTIIQNASKEGAANE